VEKYFQKIALEMSSNSSQSSRLPSSSLQDTEGNLSGSSRAFSAKSSASSIQYNGPQIIQSWSDVKDHLAKLLGRKVVLDKNLELTGVSVDTFSRECETETFLGACTMLLMVNMTN
jgi:hypothetical protein